MICENLLSTKGFDKNVVFKDISKSSSTSTIDRKTARKNNTIGRYLYNLFVCKKC